MKRVLLYVPSELRLLKNVILEALLEQALRIVLIKEPLAAAMGTGLNDADQVGLWL
ncbi:MAG: hypothetical protein ACLR5T_03190 [Veillonella sp.]